MLYNDDHNKQTLITKSEKENKEEHQPNAEIPSIIKYMGSKKPILNFITSNIEEIHVKQNPVCDLFAGSCTVSAALRKKFDFISNDIQEYSCILGKTYFTDLTKFDYEKIKEQIKGITSVHYKELLSDFSGYIYDYSKIQSLKDYQEIENKQRELKDKANFTTDYFLFVKYYSGTYWSFEQCAWIDSFRKAADHFKEDKIYPVILSSIMYAMSYTTQSTGHFAQYRDGNSVEAMNNIITYRLKSISYFFFKKLEELIQKLDNSLKGITTTTLSFQDCLKLVPENSTVYADPPYAPVHYSRFYHVLETLVKYDYPSLLFKGRYREDRHQSPFSQKSFALQGFQDLFNGVVEAKCQMVLSYSGSGVVSIESITKLAEDIFNKKNYILVVKELDHKHSTMGRFEDQNRDVIEYLIIAKFKLTNA